MVTIEEMAGTDADTGIDNVHPDVYSIIAFFGKLRVGGRFTDAPHEKRAALKRDLQPGIDLYHTL